jgi:hypothetical protein
MPIRLRCPRCRALLRIPNAQAGRRVPCPACKGLVDVPLAVARPNPSSRLRSPLIWLVLLAVVVVLLGGVLWWSVTLLPWGATPSSSARPSHPSPEPVTKRADDPTDPVHRALPH